MITFAKLEKMFTQAVNDAIRPPVLIGPKWLRPMSAGRFQYLGMPKIAKATGRSVERITQRILKGVDLDSVGLTATISKDGVVSICPAKPAKPAKPSKGAGQSRAEKPKPDKAKKKASS